MNNNNNICKKHNEELKLDLSSNSYYCESCLEEDIIISKEENDYFLLVNAMDDDW